MTGTRTRTNKDRVRKEGMGAFAPLSADEPKSAASRKELEQRVREARLAMAESVAARGESTDVDKLLHDLAVAQEWKRLEAAARREIKRVEAAGVYAWSAERARWLAQVHAGALARMSQKKRKGSKAGESGSR